MIAVIDYGAGNLRSVANALEWLELGYRIVTQGEELRAAERILLPGVGHFRPMMQALDSRDLRPALLERARAGVPLLGICLGMQALCEWSEEAPGVSGLGLIPGGVKRFAGSLAVPHMGWNLVAGKRGSDWFYFANSYYAPVGASTAAVCDYGGEFSAEVREGTVWGFQYHPEKSGPAGMRRLKEWIQDAR